MFRAKPLDAEIMHAEIHAQCKKARNAYTLRSICFRQSKGLPASTSSPIQTMTVGFGIAPNYTLRLVGFTTGRDFHPAPKIVFNCVLSIQDIRPLVKGGAKAPGNKIYLQCFRAGKIKNAC